MFSIKNEKLDKPEQLFENIIKTSIIGDNKYFIFNRIMFSLLNNYVKLDIHNKINMVENVVYTHKNLFYIIVDNNLKNNVYYNCNLIELQMYTRIKKIKKIIKNN